MVIKNTVLFCVTDFCNAKCPFCSFWKTEKPAFPKKELITTIISELKNKLDCKYLQITGGEPLTYPYVYDLIKTANDSGISTQLMTNGSLLNKEVIEKLQNSGLMLLSISFDHCDPKKLESKRGLPGLMGKIKENISILKKGNMLTTAGILITKDNWAELEKITKYALDLGFYNVGYCLPLTKTNSSYKLGDNDPDIINFSNEEMVKALQNIIKIKRKYGYKIIHQIAFLKDMTKFYSGKPQSFACKGGVNLFYLDNHLQLYQCMTKSDKLGQIGGIIKALNKKNKCYDCSLQCFREPSIYYAGIKSIIPAMNLLFSSKEYFFSLIK